MKDTGIWRTAWEKTIATVIENHNVTDWVEFLEAMKDTGNLSMFQRMTTSPQSKFRSMLQKINMIRLLEQKDNMWGYLYTKIKTIASDYVLLENTLGKTVDNIQMLSLDLSRTLNMESPKVRTLRLVGATNTGKSVIAQAIGKCFLTTFLTNTGSGSDFFLNGALNKALLVLEEIFVTQGNVDDFKTLLSGYALSVNVKQQTERETLSNTPIIATSNHDRFGKGCLSAVDETALSARCYTHHLNGKFEPGKIIDYRVIAGYLWHRGLFDTPDEFLEWCKIGCPYYETGSMVETPVPAVPCAKPATQRAGGFTFKRPPIKRQKTCGSDSGSSVYEDL